MAQKTVGYVELEWTCPNCGAKNPGISKVCQACGAPQPEAVQFEKRQNAELLHDEAKIASARKGADVHCPYCGARNAADAVVCAQCGGDLTDGQRRVAGQVIGAFAATSQPLAPIKCPSCGTENPAANQNCSACGAALKPGPVPPSVTAKPAAGAKSPARVKPWIWIPILAFFLLCCGVGAFLLLRTDSRVGVVQDATWERSIAIEALRDVTREAWRDELPQGAQPLSCSQELRQTSQEPVANAREVCGEAYTRDLGNGAAEVVQDCVYEVYDDYCKYTAEEWQNVDSAVAQGRDLNPYWPQVQVAAKQREGARTEKYLVYFQTDSGVLEFTTDDEALFLQLQPGTEWQLKVNGLGAIVSVSR